MWQMWQRTATAMVPSRPAETIRLCCPPERPSSPGGNVVVRGRVVAAMPHDALSSPNVVDRSANALCLWMDSSASDFTRIQVASGIFG